MVDSVGLGVGGRWCRRVVPGGSRGGAWWLFRLLV